jgi:hypothetical protein
MKISSLLIQKPKITKFGYRKNQKSHTTVFLISSIVWTIDPSVTPSGQRYAGGVMTLEFPQWAEENFIFCWLSARRLVFDMFYACIITEMAKSINICPTQITASPSSSSSSSS